MGEEHVDEGYDPMAFFAVPPTPAHTTDTPEVGPEAETAIIDVTEAVNAAVNSNQDMVHVDVQDATDNAAAINVIDDDLHISDDSEDEPEQQPDQPEMQPQQPPPQPSMPPPDTEPDD